MKSLRYLDKYFVKYKWRLLLGVFITILSKILALQIPRIIGKSLNSVEQYMKGTILDKSFVEEQLLWNILIIIGVAVLAGLLTFVMRQMIIVTSRLIEFDLKNEIYAPRVRPAYRSAEPAALAAHLGERGEAPRRGEVEEGRAAQRGGGVAARGRGDGGDRGARGMNIHR